QLVYPDKAVKRMFHDFARNEVVKDFLETDCDVLWFLDSDILPPIRVLDIVDKHYDKWMVAGAPYPIWMPDPADPERQPKVFFTAYNRDPDKRSLRPAPVLRNG